MRGQLGSRPEANHAVWKGALAGLIGGLAGSWVMNEFQSAWSRAAAAINSEAHQAPQQQPQSTAADEPDDATLRAAEAIAGTLLNRQLTKEEKRIAGPVVHYAFGAITGAAYGAAAELEPGVTKGYGLAFGTALWLGADEVTVPAVGLSKPPTEYPPSVHAYALASHLVYAMTADVVRRTVRAAL